MRGIKTLVAVLVVQTVVFVLATYQVVYTDNSKFNIVNSQINSIKQKQKETDKNLGDTTYKYNDVANALSYYETSTDYSIEKINKTLIDLDNLKLNDLILEEKIDKTAAKINKLTSTDFMLDVRVKVLQERMTQQETNLKQVKKVALGNVSKPVIVLNTEPTVTPKVVMSEVIEEEPVLHSCPIVDKRVSYKSYIKNILFSKELKFTVTYDVQDNKLSNIMFNKNISLKLIEATINYMKEAVSTQNNMVKCRISFKIKNKR